jgi:RNA polymerase sigma factor (sigma-70 family)
VLRNTHAAEDVAQSTFQLLATSANGIRRPEALAAWLHQTARHLALKHLRKETRRVRRESQLTRRALADHAQNPLDDLTVRELLEIFDEELVRLRDQNRLPLLLCVLQDLSQKQAAERLGWSVQQIKGGLERGRAQLRKALVRRGLTGAAVAVSFEVMEEIVHAQPLPAKVASAISAAAIEASAGGSVIVNAFGIARNPARFFTGIHFKALSLTMLASSLLLAGVGAMAICWPAGGSKVEISELAGELLGAQAAQRFDLLGDPLPEGALARMGTTRWRAPGEVTALALAPDGKTAAVAGRGDLRLYDVTTGKPLWTIDNLGFSAGSAAFSPDGTRLAVCDASQSFFGPGCKVKVWRVRDGVLLQVLDTAWIRRFGWTGDGELQGVFVDNGAIVVGNLAGGKKTSLDVSGLDGPPAPASPITFSSTSGLVAVTDYRANQPEIHTWDATTGKNCSVLYCPNGPVWATALSSKGKHLASLTVDNNSGKATVHIWDVAAAKILHTLGDKNSLFNVAFSPDDKALVAVGRQHARVWEVATGREMYRTQEVNSLAKEVAFSPKSKEFLTAERNGPGLHLWDVATGALRPEPVAHQSAPASVAFSPDGSRVVSGGMDGQVITWDANTGASRTRLQQRGWCRTALFSEDGSSIYSLATDDKIHITNAVDGREEHVLDLADPERPGTRQSGLSLWLLDDQRTLVAFSSYYSIKPGGPNDGQTLITGWDPLTQQLLFRRRSDAVGVGACISPDGRVRALAPAARGAANRGGRVEEHLEWGGPILFEDLRSGRPLFSLPPHEGQERPTGFSPDGRLLVTWKFWDGTETLQLWETATGSKLLTLPAILNGRFSFSPDGRLLAMNPSAQEILLWDFQLGKEVRRIRGFDARVATLAFSPDGRRLASGLHDSTLLVWDVAAQNRRAPHYKLNAAEIDAAWTELASGDAAAAFKARKLLASSPGSAVSFLKEKLKPEASPNAAVVNTLIADLGSDRLAHRDKAHAELGAMGDLMPA